MKLKLTLLFCFINPILGFSQWQTLGKGLSGEGRDMFYDSSSNKLYVGGFFNYADSILVNTIATWDGTHWDSLDSGARYSVTATAICKYQSHIFVSSAFYFNPINNYNWLAWWNGIYWDTLNERVNNPIIVFKIYNNDLYLGGAFNKIGSQNYNLIAKFDGNNFSSFPLPSEAGGYAVNAIEFFQGDMYVGGNFYDTITGVNDLERWDGNSFQPFGGNGLAFGGDWISSMVIYNNDLYIAGGFDTSTGSPGNNIVRWDGNQFHDVGGGVSSQIRRMKVLNGSIYISGDFYMAGNVPIHNYMAKWDGSQWSEVFPDTLDNIITDFNIFNGDLYITGGFTMIDTTHFNHIAKYSGYNGISEIANNFEINISPNPVNTQLYISNKRIILNKILITDILGKQIYSSEINSMNYQIDVSFLTSGIYFLLLETKEGKVVKKFVKE